MKHRRASILFVIFACICASTAGLYFAFRKPPKGHYEQLQQGMSRAEVESILGGHPSESQGEGVSWWYGNYGRIRAHFDENGELAECILYPPPYGAIVSIFVRIEDDVHWHLNRNEYVNVILCKEGYSEFPSGGPYAERPPQILVPPKDRGVIPPLIIFETDGASSIRR